MDFAKVQKLLDYSYSKGGIIGISITLSHQGIRNSFQAGYANLEKKRLVTEDTVFPIASCTKSFLAVAAAILAQRGILSLDEPVRSYMPELSMVDKYAQENVTLRDLLSHRWGMPRHDLVWVANINDGLTAADIVRRIKYLPPFTTFRGKYAYTNIGYVLAGQVVEKVIKKPWNQLVKEEIFDTLGMKNISCDLKGLESHADKATRYKLEGDEYRPMPHTYLDPMGPASCINTSMAELIKWVEAQFGNSGLDPRALKECHTPQMVVQVPSKNPAVDFTCFGLGFSINTYRGEKLIAHTGMIEGFTSAQFFMPGLGISGVVAASSIGAEAYMQAYLHALAEIATGHDPDWDILCEWIKPAAPPVPKEAPFAPALPLDAYIGEYVHEGYGKIAVTFEEDKLIGKVGSSPFGLEHITQNNFLFNSIAFPGIGFPGWFITGPEGVVALDIPLEPALAEPLRFYNR